MLILLFDKYIKYKLCKSKLGAKRFKAHSEIYAIAYLA